METVQQHIRKLWVTHHAMSPNVYYPQYPGTSLPVVLLPLPPSTNHLYSTVMKGTGLASREHPHSGRVPVRVKSPEYKAWLEEANVYAMVQNYPVPFNRYPTGTAWYFTLGVYLPAYTRDISNVVKPVEDWLALRLGLDDRYVRGFCVRRWAVKGDDFAGLEALVYLA